MPHNNNQQPYSNLYQISLTWSESSIGTPTIWPIHIGNFQNTQVINPANQGTNQSNRHQSVHVITQTIPKQPQFSKESLYWWKSLKAQHCNSPSLCLSSGNLVQISQIPNILRPRNINTCVCLNVLGVRLCSVERPHNQPPNHHRANNVKKQVDPKPLSKKDSVSTERHQKQPHVPYAGKRQQTFQGRLSQWSKHTNNKASASEKLKQGASKTNRPYAMETTCPEKQNLNFWQCTNHQSYTTPSSHINVCRPHVQRSLSQFPQQAQANKPKTQPSGQAARLRHCQQFCVVTFSTGTYQNSQQFLNRTQFSVCCLAVKQTNSKQQKPTTECPKQEIFHSSFNCIRSCIIHPTQNNNGKTLQFQTNIQTHQVYSVAKQMNSKQKQKSQIDVFQVYNSCPFLPWILQKQENSSLSPHKALNIDGPKITTEYPTWHQTNQRTIPKQTNHQKTNSHCPHVQMTLNMQRSRNRLLVFCDRGIFIPSINSHRTPQLCGGIYFFCYRIIQRTATIPNKSQKTNKKKSLRRPNNNIQNHKSFCLFLGFPYGEGLEVWLLQPKHYYLLLF